jgi:hypothetical protein
VGDGIRTSGFLFGYLIWCFVFILCLCVFLEMLRCKLVSSQISATTV